jgi:lipoprotein-anchoring transpeptidase ErfK/SrfK
VIFALDGARHSESVDGNVTRATGFYDTGGHLAVKQLLCLCLIGWITPELGEAASQKRRGARNRVAEPPLTEAVNNPAWTGTSPGAMLRAQILLDRANFSPGEIDGRSGANFDRAVRAFQQARKLAVTGVMDEPTWLTLNSDTRPVLVPYRIAAKDVAGPFVKVPRDIMAQAKLERLAYTSPQEALGEQFHVSPGLLTRLNPGKAFRESEELLVPDVATTLTGKAAKLVVTKAGALTVFDASGNVLAHYPCSSGSERDPLPIGTWKITLVKHDPVFHYNPKLFWDADPSHSKAKIAPGPNNPVGVVWIDLSKEHYGIHGTPEPGNIGHTQSHGCIRLTNWDVRELAGLVSKGLPVELTE